MKTWQTVPMGELCSIQSGKSDTKDAIAEGPYAFFDRSKSIKRSSRFLRDCEALIIPGEGAEFLPRHFLGKFDLHQRAYALFDFSPCIEVRFLYHYLHHVADYFPSVAVGATVKSLRLRHFEQLPVRLTDPATQRRIVAILDEAFEGIATAKANAEKNLQNARELFDGYLRDVFLKPQPTWLHTVVERHIRFIDYRGKTPQKTPEGLRLITAKNVKKGFIQEEPMEFVAPESYGGWMTRGIPKLGDVLFTTEAPLGNVAQLDTAERVVFAQRVIVMQADPTVLDSTFLKYLLLSQPIQAKLQAQATGATAQGIKASLLKRIAISFPETLGEQVAIVGRLDSLAKETSRLEQLCAAKLAALDELKRSLLHQAFSGGLS